VSRGSAFRIHGVASKEQPETSHPAVSKRMPVAVWELEDLCKASEGACQVPRSCPHPVSVGNLRFAGCAGRVSCWIPADGVFVLQNGRITKCGAKTFRVPSRMQLLAPFAGQFLGLIASSDVRLDS
jgi:hypothetical protein